MVCNPQGTISDRQPGFRFTTENDISQLQDKQAIVAAQEDIGSGPSSTIPVQDTP